MLLTLLGWFYIIVGVLFFLKPEKLRNKMKKKGVRKLKFFFLSMAFIIGILLIKAAWGVPGLLAKIIVLCGFIAIIKGIFFIKGKSADALIEWYLSQPLKFYRITAVAQVIFGAILLSV